VVGADAIRVEPPAYGFAFDNEETNFARGSISASAPIIGGGMANLKVRTRLMSAVSPGSAPPDICKLFRGSAMAQTLLAADVTGTAQDGAAGTITLASGASAVDNAYRGLVLQTDGGTGSGQRRVITAYDGTSKAAAVYPDFGETPDATTTYTIRKSALLTPITAAQEALTLYAYLRNSASGGSARLRKLVAAMAGWSIAVSARKTATVDFSFQGQMPALPTDVSDPGAPTLVGNDPLPYINAQTFLGGVAVKFNDFTLDSGNKPGNFDDPSQAYGYDTTEIVGRVMTGKITPALSLLATMNAVSDWLASTSKPLWLCWGAPGQGVSIYLPAIRYTGNEPSSVNGFEAEGLPFRATGDDLEVLICFF
jgi:hypothetical protein